MWKYVLMYNMQLLCVGKTAVRKMLFDEAYTPNEGPMQIANVGSSVAPVRIKQRCGWKLSRNADKDDEITQRSLEDYVTAKIFQYMRKKRKVLKSEGTTGHSTPSSTGSNIQSTESGHRRPSSSLSVREHLPSDYLVVDIPSPRLNSPPPEALGSGDTPNQLRYTTYDMATSFSQQLQEALPANQLQNIYEWWGKRNKISELPPLEPMVDMKSGHARPPLQANDCLMSVSEFCGEPSLICLLPLVFSSRWVYLLTYNLSVLSDSPAKSWESSKIFTCDSALLNNGDVLVEWMCTAIATAGVRNELNFPHTLSSDHPHLPVMLLVGTNAYSSQDNASLKICTRIHELAPSAGMHLMLDDSKGKTEVVMVQVSCNLEEERRQDQSVALAYLRRELELNTCRNLCTFAQNIPLTWTTIYLYLRELQKDRRKNFLFLDQLHQKLRDKAQVFVDVTTVQVALKYFHSFGLICYFHQHPQLREIVFLQPESFLAALSSILVPHTNWRGEELQVGYQECLKRGILKRNMLFLIFDSGKHSLDFNVCLYVLDALNIICLHPILNVNPRKLQYIIPCLVQDTLVGGFFPDAANEDEAEWLVFEAQGTLFPWAVYNQLVTCCSRSFLSYLPKLWQGVAHFQLTNYQHLIIAHVASAVTFRVERNNSLCEFCTFLPETQGNTPPSSYSASSEGSFCHQCKKRHQLPMLGGSPCVPCPECAGISPGPAALDNGVCHVEWKATIRTGLGPTEFPHIMEKIKKTANNSFPQSVRSLTFPFQCDQLPSVCPDTLKFLCDQLSCIRDYWFPGFHYKLKTKHWPRPEGGVHCDKKWKASVNIEELPAGLRCWWE